MATRTNQDGWDKSRAANTDPYGKDGIDFTERWANLMEEQIAEGKQLADIAKTTSHEANIDGITGFMYGCAVALLSECWVHGEELRRWHNLVTQIGTESEAANENGGVLNPALLTIEEK